MELHCVLFTVFLHNLACIHKMQKFAIAENLFPPFHLLTGSPSITENNGCLIFREVWLPSLCSSY